MVREKSLTHPRAAPGWAREDVFVDGDTYFGALLEAVDSARDSIDCETYIFTDDALGCRVIEGFEVAARRGVRVRLLVDGVGSFQWRKGLLGRVSAGLIQFRFYHPISPNLSQLNRRNHRKTCVIDGRVAFLGSFNIDARHLASVHGKQAWRDTGARIEGDEVTILTRAFERAWSPPDRMNELRRVLKGSARDRPRLVRLNDHLKWRRGNFRERLHRIAQAQERVWITTPYFVPSRALLRALRLAAWSGCDVRLLLPSRNDVFFMRWVNHVSVFLLLRAGVRVFEFLPRFIHAKILLIDDWALIGSSNLNQRSLIHDLEADIVLAERGSIGALTAQFEADLAESREITDSYGLGGYGLLGRLLHWLFRNWL